MTSVNESPAVARNHDGFGGSVRCRAEEISHTYRTETNRGGLRFRDPPPTPTPFDPLGAVLIGHMDCCSSVSDRQYLQFLFGQETRVRCVFLSGPE